MALDELDDGQRELVSLIVSDYRERLEGRKELNDPIRRAERRSLIENLRSIEESL